VHAWRRREDLELTPLERFITKATMREQAIQIGIAATSVTLAVAGQPGWAGLVYVTVGPVMALNGTMVGKRRRREFGE